MTNSANDLRNVIEDICLERQQHYSDRTIDAIIEAFKTSLAGVEWPNRYTLQTGLLWDSQDATDGYHQGLDDCKAALQRFVEGL